MGMSVKRLQKIIEQQGWNVSIENLGKNAKCVELQRFTPAGQDFNISVEMSGNDVKSFIHNLYGFIILSAFSILSTISYIFVTEPT